MADRFLESHEGPELAAWLERRSNWRTLVAELIIQEGQSQSRSKFTVDRAARAWSIADHDGRTVASFGDGMLWTEANGVVGQRGATEFENGPSVGFDMIFPWQMPSWGRERIDDFVPLTLRNLGIHVVVVSAHRLEPTMTKGVALDREHAIAMRVTEFDCAAVLTVLSIA